MVSNYWIPGMDKLIAPVTSRKATFPLHIDGGARASMQWIMQQTLSQPGNPSVPDLTRACFLD